MTYNPWLKNYHNLIFRASDPNYGRGVALIICSLIEAVCFISQSVLQAFQNEICAYTACVLHTIGRMFSVFFNPMLFYIFPPRFFGFMYGIMTLWNLPWQYLSIPMLDYIKGSHLNHLTYSHSALCYVLMQHMLWWWEIQIIMSAIARKRIYIIFSAELILFIPSSQIMAWYLSQ